MWRAVNEQNGTSTEWNLSWVDSDTTAGWLKFAVSGSDDALTCEFIAKGTFDDSITHNRDSIPEALPLHDLEARLMDDQRYPDLTGPNALFTGSGLHDSTRVGYLVVVPGTGFGIDFSDLLDTSGATTVDLQGRGLKRLKSRWRGRNTSEKLTVRSPCWPMLLTVV